MLTNGLYDVVVPLWRDLDLYAFVTGVKLGLNFLKELLDRILNADRNAALDLVSHAAEMPPERNAQLFWLRGPSRRSRSRPLTFDGRGPFSSRPRHRPQLQILCRRPSVRGSFRSLPMPNRSIRPSSPAIRRTSPRPSLPRLQRPRHAPKLSAAHTCGQSSSQKNGQAAGLSR